jgi:hypothetical protein
MAAAESKFPTLVDVATRLDPDGKVAAVAELLNETNEVLDDAMFLEANDGSSHKTTVRSGLPSATWRQLNYGVQPSKSTTVPIKDACGMLEAYAEVDKALADLNGNTAAFRLSEDRAFVEAMNQGFVDTLIYGNTAVNPERFMGLAPRYSSLAAENGGNIIAGGGSGSDNTSIWLCVWGANTLHGLYPKGSLAGLQHTDKGQVTLEDANKGKYEGYRTHYKWDCGLTLRDWRYVVRIANIDVSELTADGATGAKLMDLMIQALEIVPNLSMGKAVFYCNRTIKSYLRRQMLNKSNVHLNMSEVAGKHVMGFDGIPVKKCDAILNTEATVA